jgi:general stress protein 26
MDSKEKVREIIEGHNLMHISTVDSKGMPRSRGVDFVSGEAENILYFITQKCSGKVKEIKNNANVFVVIDHDCPNMEELSKLKYFKASGKAEIIEKPEGIQKVFGKILQKFPYLKDLPGDPSAFVAVKVILKEINLSDNAVQFGHTETINY